MADSGQFLCVVKREWIQAVSDNDQLPISNLGALRMGLQALLREDAEDDARAEQLWAKAMQLLENESADDEGAGATGRVQVEDDFDVQSIGGPVSYGGYW